MKTLFYFSVIAMLAMPIKGLSQKVGETYRLMSMADTTRSMFVKNSSFSQNASVVAWTETDVPAQQWTVQMCNDGSLRLVNVLSGLYLTRQTATLSANVAVVQSDVTTDRSSWRLNTVEGSTDCFTIQPAMDGGETYALSSSATSDGSTIRLAKLDKSDKKQQWRLIQVKPWNKVSAEMRKTVMDSFLKHFEQTRTSSFSTLGEGGGWGDAEMIETILDALEVTGDAAYARLFERVYGYIINNVGTNFCQLVYNDSYKWYGHEFNDDVMWLVIAAARASILTGDTKYLNHAKANFNRVYSRALLDCGLLRWKEGNGDGTNSCINCPTVIAACYIAKSSGDESYYEKARSIYLKERARLYSPTDGHVFDSMTADANGLYSWNTWASTYNQGTFMGAALLLYEHYRDPMFAADAAKAFDYTREKLCSSDGVINVCQTVSGDLCGFKGILMRYVRRLVVDLDREDAMQWLQRQALFAFSNRNSDGIVSSAWLTKSGEDYRLAGIDDSDFSEQAFGCSTVVSAVFNAPLSVDDFRKDAYIGFEAARYNYMKGITVTEDTENDNKREIAGEKTGYYLAYNNVDFGHQAANKISLNLSPVNKDNCRIEVYADSLSGQLLGTLQFNQTAEWQEHTANITPIEGQHTIYLRFRNASVATVDAYRLDSICFSSSLPFMTASLMSHIGTINISEKADDTAKMTDAQLSTATEISANDVSVTFALDTVATVRAYALGSMAGASSSAPTAWMLEGSKDGNVWIELDSQTAQQFTDDGELKIIELSTEAVYSKYRLHLLNAHSGAENITISEWQLFGTYLSTKDITSDGGTFTVDKSAQKVYQAKGAYKMAAYSITTTVKSLHSWKLEGSNDRKEWTRIDEQNGTDFRYDGSTQFYDVVVGEPFSNYRLTVDEADADDFKLQIFGELNTTSVLCNGILHSGGLLSASDGSKGETLKAVTDHDATTFAVIPYSEGNCYLQYEAPMKVKPLSFGVMGSLSRELNPRSVRLDASLDGQTWTTLATATVSTTVLGQMRDVAVNTNESYKYFRLNILSRISSTSDNVAIAEWQLNGTAVSAEWPAAMPTAASLEGVPTSAEQGVEQLYDTDPQSHFDYQCFVPSSIVYDFVKPLKTNVYSITASDDDSSFDPTAWTLYGSYDGIEWTEIDRRSGITFKERLATQFYPLGNAYDYSHYRLQVDAIGGNDQFICKMSELQFGYSQNIISDGIAVVKDSKNSATVAEIDYNAALHELTVSAPADTMISLYDVSGRQILARRDACREQTISLLALEDGAYIVKAESNLGTVVKKILR